MLPSDNEFISLLRPVCAELDRAGIVYALTGSIVSGVYGEPISSLDIDIALNMSESQAGELAKSLPARFYRSEDALREAVRFRRMANLIDAATQMKIDLCMLPDSPYYRGVLARRQLVEFLPGASFWSVTPEDIILMKLDWRRDTQSQKQWDNALSVVRTRGVSLDWKYLRDWADQLKLSKDLVRLQTEGGL